MTVQNVYNISNHGTMYFPAAAQGTQCGDYNRMYTSLLPPDDACRNADSDADKRNLPTESQYEHIDSDIEVVSF